MPLSVDLGGVGLPMEQALRLGFQILNVNAAGTTQGAATPLRAPGNIYAIVVPAASQQGVALPVAAEVGSEVYVSPTLATPLISVYPPTGHTIDLLAVNLPITFATANKNARFIKVSATNWRSFVSGAV